MVRVSLQIPERVSQRELVYSVNLLSKTFQQKSKFSEFR